MARKEGRCLLERRLDLLGQLAFRAEEAALAAAAELKDQRIQAHCIVLQSLRRLLCDLQQLLLLPAHIQHREIVLFLIGGDAGGHLHALGKEADHLIVDGVNARPVFAQFHLSDFLSALQQRVIHRDRRRRFHHWHGPGDDAGVMPSLDLQQHLLHGIQIHAPLLF